MALVGLMGDGKCDDWDCESQIYRHTRQSEAKIVVKLQLAASDADVIRLLLFWLCAAM